MTSLDILAYAGVAIVAALAIALIAGLLRFSYSLIHYGTGYGKEGQPPQKELLGKRLEDVQADALMDARYLVIGTPGFNALTKRAAELRESAHP